MPDALKSKREKLDKASKEYQEFKGRTEKLPILSGEEKGERIEYFLDAHVSIFDDYFDAWSSKLRKQREAGIAVTEGEGLSPDAKDMAEDIAAVFPDSKTRDYYNTYTEGRGEMLQRRYFENRGNRLFSADRQKRDPIKSYVESARLNFREQERATALQPPPERQLELANLTTEEAMSRLEECFEEDRISLQKEISRLQSQYDEAQNDLETKEQMAEAMDYLLGDQPGDTYYLNSTDSAWEEVQNARENTVQKLKELSAARKELELMQKELEAGYRINVLQRQHDEAQSALETKEQMAENEDDLGIDQPDDVFYQSHSESAWEEVQNARENEAQKLKELSEAKEKRVMIRTDRMHLRTTRLGAVVRQLEEQYHKAQEEYDEEKKTVSDAYAKGDTRLDADDPAMERLRRKLVTLREAQKALDIPKKELDNAQKDLDDLKAYTRAQAAYTRDQAERIDPVKARADQRRARADQAQPEYRKALTEFKKAQSRATDTQMVADAAKKGNGSKMSLSIAETANARAQAQLEKASEEWEFWDQEQSPVMLRQKQRQTEMQNNGLSPDQMKGLRDIAAFLYRNVKYGAKEKKRNFTGAFVDGIVSRPPFLKLTAYYLIENDKLHEKLDYGKLLDIFSSYVPVLENFKPRIFNGVLGGYFGRLRGKNLNWDKLSDAVHIAEDIIREAVSQLPLPQGADDEALIGQFAAAAGDKEDLLMDPEIVNKLQKVSAAGKNLLENPAPSRPVVEELSRAVNDLNTYISSLDKSKWEKAQGVLSIIDEISEKAGEIAETVGTGLLIDHEIEPLKKGQSFIKSQAGWGMMSSSAAEVPIAMISTLLSIVNTVDSIVDTCKSGKSGLEKAVEISGIFKNIGSAAVGAYENVRATAGLVHDIQTLKDFKDPAGSWASGNTAVGFAGWGTIGLGIINGADGVIHIVDASMKHHDYRKYIDSMPEYQPDEKHSKAQIEELNAQKHMLTNAAVALRHNETRQIWAGGFQTASAALQIASGAITLTTGGLASFASLGISAAAFVVGMAGVIVDYVLKRRSKFDVIDRYIDLEGLYSRFKKEHGQEADPKGFEKKYGKEGDIKKQIRKTAEAYLGFPSDDKMHDYIMRRYAQALYNGAFLKRDGTVLTSAEESNPRSNEREDRRLYTDLLKTMRFKVVYPDNKADPPVKQSPDFDTILNRFIS